MGTPKHILRLDVFECKLINGGLTYRLILPQLGILIALLNQYDLDLTKRAVSTSIRYYLRRAIERRESGYSLEAAAFRTIQISKGDYVPAVRPYFREEQIKRVGDAEWYSARQIIEEHLNRRMMVLRPLQVHEFRDAYLIDGSVYLGGMTRIDLRSGLVRRSALRRLSVLPVAPQLECSEAALVASVAGSTWFGHWLEDEVPLQMLAANFGPAIAHLRSEYPHEPDYRRLLNLPAPTRVGTAHVKRLAVIDEFAQNRSKAHRYWRIREQLARQPKGTGRVFLNRGQSGTIRYLRNEVMLLERFRAEGYSVVDVATASLSEILRVLNGASVVVSVEGSHLAHALYSMVGFGSMVILNPPQRAYTTVADIAPFCSLHASMFICDPNDDGSFSADVDELLGFVEDAIADARARRGALERFLVSLRQHRVEVLNWSSF